MVVQVIDKIYDSLSCNKGLMALLQSIEKQTSGHPRLLCFAAKHYWNITNWSTSEKSKKKKKTLPLHPLQYKSLVIALLPCPQVCWIAPALFCMRSKRMYLSHLVWVAQVCCPLRDCSSLFLKGYPTERAVHHQTSQCVKILPVSSAGQALVDRCR